MHVFLVQSINLITHTIVTVVVNSMSVHNSLIGTTPNDSISTVLFCVSFDITVLSSDHAVPHHSSGASIVTVAVVIRTKGETLIVTNTIANVSSMHIGVDGIIFLVACGKDIVIVSIYLNNPASALAITSVVAMITTDQWEFLKSCWNQPIKICKGERRGGGNSRM